MKIRSKDHAEKAYPLVNAIKNTDIETQYRTLALNFPTMILQSGLVQAVGFLRAKGEKEHLTLAEHISQLLGYQTVQRLHDELLQSDITKYQLLTRNAIEATSWLKRYTQALLKKEGEA